MDTSRATVRHGRSDWNGSYAASRLGKKRWERDDEPFDPETGELGFAGADGQGDGEDAAFDGFENLAPDAPTVEELIKGIIVLSGNDACVVVAEGLAGTEEAFAREMTARAHELGLTDTHLVNASGWPAPGHVMSASDLGKLAQHLVQDFPEYYRNFALDSFDYDGRAPANTRNRNPILGLGIGADGLKTGYLEESGYALTGSAVQNGQRLIMVVSGLKTARDRAERTGR